MSTWLVNLILNYVVPIAVSIIKNYGIPALEQKFPALVPLLTELLTLLGGTTTNPTPALHAAAEHYKALTVKA